MKKIISASLLISVLIACNNSKRSDQSEEEIKMNYPETKKVDTIDHYFGTEVKDPYRWLEDDRSEETKEWVVAQNEVIANFLDKIPYRKQLKERLTQVWNYEKYSSPSKEGEFTYFFKNDGLQNQSVLYRQKEGGEVEVFLDPNTFSEEGTISLGGLEFTKDGSLLAYSISEGGSDWRKIIVIDVASKEQIEDTLVDVKFSGISWKENEGFYYSSYDKPDGSELSAKTDQHKLYYHQLGTQQENDQVVFGEEIKRRYVGGAVTEDGKYLEISAANTTSGNELYIQSLESIGAPIVAIVDNYKTDQYILHHENNYFFIITNLDAPNKRLIKVKDDGDLSPENWEDLIPETENVLQVSISARSIFAKYMVNAISEVKQYDFEGKLIRNVELPGKGTAGGFNGEIDAQELYYSYTNYCTPSTLYKFDPKTGDTEIYKKPIVDFESENYESNQVFYSSKDGTKVPMIITHKKGIKLDGTNPTILYGYGGFNISLTPAFSISRAVWLEQGGVYAVPNLRGGGEFGKEWHKAGTQLQKQNVFDDFIAAAEFLIQEKYTSSDFLAISGGSNGGLLVGATMTQRPKLMKVALPAVGVLDMLRYHTFTAGAGWSYDYGTAEDNKEMFEYLKNYSPVHNVDSVEYPATMVTTGDHDDRVVPAHSFKFAATLQEFQQGNHPTLIRIETDAGHGAGTPVSKSIDLYADVFGFTLYSMGIKELKN